jgi:hypothetical protein
MKRGLIDRFTEKIAEPFDAHNECWIWTGWKNLKGYGQFWLNGGDVPSQRVAHELFIGPIPEGYHVDHICKNRACVRPDHLQVLTHFENSGQARRDKTHCLNGHEFSESNTYVFNGMRHCKTCVRDRMRKYLARKRGLK